MSRAVRYDQHGSIDVLQVIEVPEPTAGPGEVVVAVVAAGINPGEVAIREGRLPGDEPHFPSGQGSDFAGRVHALGDGVEAWQVGDEVIGYSWTRSSQAELTVVPAGQLTAKPAAVDWNQAGALYVAGATAFAAVAAVDAQRGDTIAVSGAAGGVGSLVIQLLRARGVRVLGIAGPDNAGWLQEQGVEPIAYGDGLARRLRDAAPDGIDAFIDTFGGGYVEQAVGLGIDPQRIDTIIDFAAVDRFGVKAEGSAAATSAEVLAELAGMIADGALTVPIAATYPLEQVREAYTELERRHTRGKIVLRTD